MEKCKNCTGALEAWWNPPACVKCTNCHFCKNNLTTMDSYRVQCQGECPNKGQLTWICWDCHNCFNVAKVCNKLHSAWNNRLDNEFA